MTVVAGNNNAFGQTTEQIQVGHLSVLCFIFGHSHNDKYQVNRGVNSRPSGLKSLSRHLRGGASPVEVVTELHEVVTSKLDLLENIQDMHEVGNEAALASSVRALIGDTSTAISDLKESGGLALTPHLEDGLDLAELGAASDSVIAEYFDMDFFGDMIWQLQDLDKILRDVMSLLQNRDSQQNDQVSKEGHPHPEERGQVSANARERRLGEGLAGTYDEHVSPLDTPSDWFDRLLQDTTASTSSQYDDNIPPVCLDQCAPTNATCLCERLADCVGDMTHFDLAVLFANGFISDGQIGGDVRLFNVADNAWDTFDSIMNTPTRLDPSNLEQCTGFLEQFHQPCNTLDEQTCSSENVRSFQLSVDQVCEFIDR